MQQLAEQDGAPSRASPASYGELARYFFPLAIQAASQSLTYPLVAMVASRGAGGTLNLAGVAQANSMMFLLGTIGAGLVTAGMMYARTREGHAAFVRVNTLLALVAGLVQALLCIPTLAHALFGSIINLPPNIEAPTRAAFLAQIPLQVLFFLRNPYQVCLYVHGATGLASAATILRIAMTAALSPAFSALGLVGPTWAVVCMTVPVTAEAILSWYFARPHLKALAPSTGAMPKVREVLLFTLPLSLGGFFLSLSSMVTGAVIARAPRPEEMLPAYYLAAGLAGPMAYAATRMQALTIAFPPTGRGGRRLLRFGLLAGALSGFFPLLFTLPGLADWYYVGLQKCRPEMLNLVRWSALGLLLHPLTMSIRSYAEGKAAVERKPIAVLTGQGAFLAVLALLSFTCLALNLSGNLIAPISLLGSNLAAAGIIHASLTWDRREVVPVQIEREYE